MFNRIQERILNPRTIHTTALTSNDIQIHQNVAKLKMDFPSNFARERQLKKGLWRI